MSSISSKLYSIINFKCPRCHNGDLYETPTLSFRRLFVMKENCTHCNQQYMLEPGFYWGAMYISYMLSSGIMLGSFLVFYFLLDLGIVWSFAAILAVAIVFYGLIFRTARAIWINLFVHYDPSVKSLPNTEENKN